MDIMAGIRALNTMFRYGPLKSGPGIGKGGQGCILGVVELQISLPYVSDML